jgi:hypothetical protein
MNMTDFFRNDFTKAFSVDQVLAFQSEFVKQATEANKRIALETLKTTKTFFDAFSHNIDSEIKRLNGAE